MTRLIDADALKAQFIKAGKDYNHECAIEMLCALETIDNAPTVDIKDQIAGAYNEGYMCGNKEAEKGRPQDERVDISKLRLMTVEECAGHTIDYAMGWKACVEWIKKGGAV